MNQIKVPGVVYSLALAILAWAAIYLQTGEGAGIPWAPIAIAIIPMVIKAITLSMPPPVAPLPSIRGLEDAPVKVSIARQWMLG